ncbi:MAG: CCA tRNA nucleotidyltransferase [Desulfurococcaceae archaeon]
MHSLSDLERQILMKIKPSHDEYRLILGSFEKISDVIKAVLAENNISAEVTLQGSVAHDTWLSGDWDLDIFVLFPEKWTREDIEKEGFRLLLESAKRIGNYELRYAEHPYIRVKLGKVEADLVPALNLSDLSATKTSVDRTPFHTKYINATLSDEQKDHVRLLKKFMKAIGVYGAEVKTHGFSGYAVELLIGVYGDFKSTLKEASTWQPPIFINTMGESFTKEIKDLLLSRYPDSYIYMPDPVDPRRNLGASVSLKSLATFILASWCYMRNPSVEFFVETIEPSLEDLVNILDKRCILFVIYELPEALPPDVIWGEIQRVSSRLSNYLEIFGLNVVDHSVWSNGKDIAIIGIELESCWLSSYKLYRGPCISHEKERITNFIQAHLGKGYGPWIDRDGCLSSLDRRRYTDAVELITSRWKDYSVSPHLKNLKPTVEVASKDVVIDLLMKGAGAWLSEFASKMPKWMEKCIS